MDLFDVLFVMLLLQVKHFFADFYFQGPYQYLNKGNFKHPGGYLHAFIHSILTGGILWSFDVVYF